MTSNPDDAPPRDDRTPASPAEAATPRETPSSVEASSPVVEKPSPVVETSSPVVETSSPVVETSSPVVETSSPVVETSSPVVTEEEVDVPEAEAAPTDPPNVPEREQEPEQVSAERAPGSARPAFESAPTSVSSIAPAIELSDDFTSRPTFWSTRPNRSWMLVGGSAIVIAFLAGGLTSRAVQPEPSPVVVATASLPTSQSQATIAAPVPAPAQPLPTSDALPSTPSNDLSKTHSNAAGPANEVGPSNAVGSAKRPLPGFNAKAAKAAIDGVAPRLKSCRHAGDPSGPATVVVTFAPAGRVASASVTTPGYAGTRTGDCVAQRLRELRIPEYVGAPVTVKRSVTVR